METPSLVREVTFQENIEVVNSTETQGQYEHMLSLANQADQDCKTHINKSLDDLQDSELVNKDLGDEE